MPPEDYILAMKYEVFGQAVCIFNLILSKATIGLFLLRIVFETWHKAVIWFVLGTNSILVIWCTVAIFIQCVPVQMVWGATTEGHCWLDFAKIGLATSGTPTMHPNNGGINGEGK